MRQTIQKFTQMNRSHKPLKAIGVALHETATPGATAENEYTYFNLCNRGASAHAFVDWNETIQTLPWDEQAWHAKEPANSMFIGIEMCRPAQHDPDKFNIVYNETVALFSRLFYLILKINKVTKDNLMSHDEIRMKWHNTTHTDPTAYLAEYGKNMDMFRRDVQAAIDALQQAGKVKTGIVMASLLNVRSAPTTTAPIVKSLKKDDAVTILDHQGDWYQIGTNQWVNDMYIKI